MGGWGGGGGGRGVIAGQLSDQSCTLMIMMMMMIPLPHYDYFATKIFRSENYIEAPPPPPRLFQGWCSPHAPSSARHFATPKKNTLAPPLHIQP